MELIHASKLLQEWFNKLPPETQAWLIKAYWVVVPLGLMFLIYAVVREEKVSESGKVTVKWYHPKQWVLHFMQIKADNEAKLQKDGSVFFIKLRQLLAASHELSDLVYDVLFVLIGLLGVLGVVVSIAMNPFKAWWFFLPSAFAVYIGVKSFKKLLALRRKE
ncbi:MAG: hypothetical protein ACKVOA_03960 [Methylophilaceae bacterium]